MLTRLMFSGGGTQVLVMQAGEAARPTSIYYGYKYGTYGKINPNYIMYLGEKYVITQFYTYSSTGDSMLYFQDNKIPNGIKMLVEINGTVYTLVKQPGYHRYYIKARLFTSVGTYTIKILSIT